MKGFLDFQISSSSGKKTSLRIMNTNKVSSCKGLNERYYNDKDDRQSLKKGRCITTIMPSSLPTCNMGRRWQVTQFNALTPQNSKQLATFSDSYYSIHKLLTSKAVILLSQQQGSEIILQIDKLCIKEWQPKRCGRGKTESIITAPKWILCIRATSY